MLRLTKHPPVARLLELEQEYTAEQWLEIELLSRPMLQLREHPDLGIIALTGITLPPHERRILYQMHRGHPSNVITASRGTSKTSTACVLYPGYMLLLYPKKSAITLSATGFRGGQLIFNDTERWMKGGWDSQSMPAPFLWDAMPRRGINRSPNYWSYEYDNHSRNLTLPTKDHDSIRGNRAQLLFLDEANTTDRNLVENIVLPFLNVQGDFEHGGRYAERNRVFYTSTIDFSWRPYTARLNEALDGIRRDRKAAEALHAKDWERYDELKVGGLFNYTYTQFDYTDLLIPEVITSRDGRKFRVHWPNKNLEPEHDLSGIPFSERNEDGTVQRNAAPCSYYRTYPVDKETLEMPLLSGQSDEASWLSEQRNIVDVSTGDVYSNILIDRVAQRGDYFVLPYNDLTEGWKRRHKDEQLDYYAPVLWKCTDPCVLGVDYAPRSDMCAFVVIRMGPLAKGTFDPMTHHGRSTFANVIWAEQHRRMTHKEVADKIRHLLERYHIVWHEDRYLTDPTLACRGIGLDISGGGEGVRDELCYINDPLLPPHLFRIYDPTDDDERLRAFHNDTTARPMLDAIKPSDGLNDRLVEFTVAQMEQGLLYLPKYLPRSQRPAGARELNAGFESAQILEHQLRKLRQKPTKNYRSFYMEGDRERDTNKKDLWAAYIYAAKQLRAHLIRQTRLDNAPVPTAALVARTGSKRRRRSNDRSPGARG